MRKPISTTIACAALALLVFSTGAAADTDPLDPTVARIVGDVSAQRIARRIEALVGFHTRHTMSETESDTRGIGAARRWIQRELQACSKAAGGRLQVEMDEYIEPAGRRISKPTTLVNVVATLPGSSPASRDRLLVVSGHYDSRNTDVMDASGFAPGANDDASGVAAVMELACVMAAHQFDATLVFMAVPGEEQGLLGATHWAKTARAKNLRIEAMITNDIVGSATGDAGQYDPKQLRLFADGFDPLLRMLVKAQSNQQTTDTDSASDAVRKQLQALALAGGSEDLPTHQLGRHLKASGERYVPGFTVNLIQRRDRYLRGGDHLPFLERGYAAVRFTEPFENFRHQHQDVRTENGVVYGDLVEFVDMPYLANVTRINAAGLATLALAPAAPQNVRLEAIELDNNSTLRWDANAEPGLKGYRVVWRETGSPTWQQHRDVGLVTRATITGVSKDNVVFGVQAIGARGMASLASYPLPMGR
ncbi:M28 family metallopeptidase [Roseateles toxinivorans]|uniref:Peptidase M28-like protein n=1 Tax=Roseateles toxinivorans TaxID=270368 RepID=A0A4R6QBI1_9BURK|nr:M28 family metallopeptidase [Roseateles toxinivorans]TDP59580.1 peptidase M28-like protein [Roseateles toxinivorans]